MRPGTMHLGVSSPKMTDEATQLRMSRTRQSDNAREVSLRSALHGHGLRFRLHRRIIEGSTRTADIVFPRVRLAVFLDGCFWHGCPIHASWPKTNADWWRAKIEANRERDRDTDERLAAIGWTVVRIWGHEKLEEVVKRVEAALGEHSGGKPS
jgi:DNA mismatch endonuclease (patch repair protein)